MGGVDLCDMFHALYRIDRRNKKQYVRKVYYLLKVATSNGWLIFKENTGQEIILTDFTWSVTLSITHSLMIANKSVAKAGRPAKSDQSCNQSTLPYTKPNRNRTKIQH